jgi:hypothetical protein
MIREPSLLTPEGITLKPDLVVKNREGVFVVQVPRQGLHVLPTTKVHGWALYFCYGKLCISLSHKESISVFKCSKCKGMCI